MGQVLGANGPFDDPFGSNGAAILLSYVTGARVEGNLISDYDQGIQWWGGDSDSARSGRIGNPKNP
jgi:hypothetical protein